MPETSPTQSSPKKRSWKHRLSWTAIILVLVALAINGPIARWTAHHFLHRALSDLGMSGEHEIDGSITSGFRIKNLSYSGNQGVQKLTIKEASIDYKLAEVFDLKLRHLHIENVSVVIDVAKFPPSSSRDESSTETPIEAVRETATLTNININQLDISLLNDNKNLAHFQIGNLLHERAKEAFHLHDFVATDSTMKSTPSQDVTLTWSTHAARLDHIELQPNIAIHHLQADWEKQPTAKALLHIHGATLNLALNKKLTANLSKGDLVLNKIDQQFALNLPFSGTVTKLQAEVENWTAPLSQWNIIAQTHLSSASFENYHFKNTSINLAQKNAHYTSSLTTQLDGCLAEVQLKGRWNTTANPQWWLHTGGTFDLTIRQPSKLVSRFIQVPPSINLSETSIISTGKFALRGDFLNAQTHSRIAGIQAGKSQLPPININASIADSQDIRASIASPTIHGKMQFHTKQSSYSGNLTIKENDPIWLNDLIAVFQQDVTLSNQTHLTWQGSGELPDKHRGELHVRQLAVKLPNTPTISAQCNTSYNWPKRLDISALHLSSNEWQANAQLHWDGKLATIPQLVIINEGKELVSVSGHTPYRASITSAEKFFAQTDPWKLNIHTQPITLKKIQSWYPIEQLKNTEGNTSLLINLAGSPHSPSLTGSHQLTIESGLGKSPHPPLKLALNLASQKQQLSVTGTLTEDNTQRVSLNTTIPFTPNVWLKRKNLAATFLDETAIEGNLTINTLPLGRLAQLIPQLDKVTGTIDGSATIAGTLAAPKYQLHLNTNIPTLALNHFDYGEFRNIKMSAHINEKQVATLTTTAEINGGKFDIKGSANLTNITNPTFDLHLNTQYTLVHRDDLMSVRANTKLNIKGSLKMATVSGNIGIVESLIYKDINLIPVGVPSSEVAKVKLPSIDASKADAGLPIPAPFDQWKLDVTLKTDDPVLIRGNLAEGSIQGSVRVRGTASRPLPSGTFYAKNVRAKLPFSVLTVHKGEVKFSPQQGLNPEFSIRGKSRVGAHDVSVFIYGSAASPKTAFTSYPPLPEHEILTLLATGTTSTGLENRDVATFKAFQLFLHQLKQRANRPGGNKLFGALLEGTEDLNLKVGEVDPFTGRKYASATVQVSPHWHLTAQVDDLQQTRGLVVYILRFR